LQCENAVTNGKTKTPRSETRGSSIGVDFISKMKSPYCAKFRTHKKSNLSSFSLAPSEKRQPAFQQKINPLSFIFTELYLLLNTNKSTQHRNKKTNTLNASHKTQFNMCFFHP
jgi:hypothetical protein